jgi:hypothetical protein
MCEIVVMIMMLLTMLKGTEGLREAPFCTNMTATWCCSTTSMIQTGSVLKTTASYGNGNGTISPEEDGTDVIVMDFDEGDQIDHLTARVSAGDFILVQIFF